jgi:DNA repair protein RecO (recombination protein O)
VPPPSTATQAIVIGTTDYGESDRIVRLLSPDLGAVAVLARRARSSKSRVGAALDLGNGVEARVRAGKGTLWHVDEAMLTAPREGIRHDFHRLTLMLHACEVMGLLAREHHPEPRLYGLLEMSLLLLDAIDAPPGDAFRLGFEGKALTFAGLSPILDRCGVCGEATSAPMLFRTAGDGAMHASCAADDSRAGRAEPVTVEWLRAAEHARRTPLRDLVDQEVPGGAGSRLAQVIEHHGQRVLRARTMLQPLEAARAADASTPGAG